jgi:hypothetical protein
MTNSTYRGLRRLSGGFDGKLIADWLNDHCAQSGEMGLLFSLLDFKRRHGLASLKTQYARLRGIPLDRLESLPNSVLLRDISPTSGTWKIDLTGYETAVQKKSFDPGLSFFEAYSRPEMGDLVTALRHLWQLRLLDRVRLCDGCLQTWFFAASQRQRFCSDGCRESFHRKTPAGKRKRAAYMRKYRKDQSELDLEARRKVGG